MADDMKSASLAVLRLLEKTDWVPEDHNLNGPMHDAIQHLRAAHGEKNTLGISPTPDSSGDVEGLVERIAKRIEKLAHGQFVSLRNQGYQEATKDAASQVRNYFGPELAALQAREAE